MKKKIALAVAGTMLFTAGGIYAGKQGITANANTSGTTYYFAQ